MTTIRRWSVAALGTFGLAASTGSLAGCSPVRFEEAAKAASPLASSATPGETPPIPVPPPPRDSCVPTGPTARLTKVLFLVDSSGSNVNWFTPAVGNALECQSPDRSGCAAPTDPTKAFRAGSIQRYFDRFRGASNFEWSFVAFGGAGGGSTSTGLMPSGATKSAFSPHALDMQAALDAFLARPDGGGTPMSSALQMAAATVAADPDRGGTRRPQYVVVLITDGYPSDYRGVGDALPDVRYLRDVAPGAVTLSAIYYGSQDSTSAAATSFLSQIAAAGGGQFANVNDPSSGIDIRTVIPGQTCQ